MTVKLLEAKSVIRRASDGIGASARAEVAGLSIVSGMERMDSSLAVSRHPITRIWREAGSGGVVRYARKVGARTGPSRDLRLSLSVSIDNLFSLRNVSRGPGRLAARGLRHGAMRKSRFDTMLSGPPC
jgi:hypothetical protein